MLRVTLCCMCCRWGDRGRKDSCGHFGEPGCGCHQSPRQNLLQPRLCESHPAPVLGWSHSVWVRIQLFQIPICKVLIYLLISLATYPPGCVLLSPAVPSTLKYQMNTYLGPTCLSPDFPEHTLSSSIIGLLYPHNRFFCQHSKPDQAELKSPRIGLFEQSNSWVDSPLTGIEARGVMCQK